MGDPVEKDKPPSNDLAGLPALFKEWQGLIVAVGGAVTAALTIVLPERTPAAVQVIGYAVAAALIGVGGFVFVRVRRRQQSRRLRERRRETWEREIAGAHQAAFRGLFPYQESDELPGEHRQREAGRLVTQFSDPKFTFGVVCGDSGCGKTSLLRSAIQRRLKAAGAEKGFSVHYVSNPRELADDGGQPDAAQRLGREMDKLRQLAASASQGKPLILIIDQFEEFFIEYSKPEQRLEIGRFLNGLIRADPPVRILCAIRRDYLADMKDLAPPSPDQPADRAFFEPISLQSLFTLKNFTVEQAARVIKECAERDRIDVDDELAETLASDLAEGDFVRPPELQIVCTALVGNLTMAEYRLSGGARGILSHHIEGAIDISGDPTVGRRVLRALCDFPAHAKRNPQTVPVLAEAIGADSPQAVGLIRTALRQFEVARLVVSEKRGEDEPSYALVHDYLVDAVAKATSDVSTRDEEANQMLEYYVSEYRADSKTRIPYRRLRFVRKYADRKKLADPTAARLVRASVLRLALSAAALTALVAVATTLLVAVTTTRRDWRQEVVGSHWEGNSSGDVPMMVNRKGSMVLTGLGEDRSATSGYVNLWDVKTAKSLHTVRGRRLMHVPPDYVLSIPSDEPFVYAFHLQAGRQSQTTLPAVEISNLRGLALSSIKTNQAGDIIAFRGDEDYYTEEEERRRLPPPTVKVFSLAGNKFIGEAETCLVNRPYGFEISNDGEHYLQICGEQGRLAPTVFNVLTREKKVLLREGGNVASDFAFDAQSSRAVTLERANDGRIYLVLWDARSGRVLDQIHLRLSGDEDEEDDYIYFTPDGAYAYVYSRRLLGQTQQTTFSLFSARGPLRRVPEVPESGVRFINASSVTGDTLQKQRTILAWPKEGGGGMHLWDLAEAAPRLVDGLALPEDMEIDPETALTQNGVRALVILKEQGRVELWDFKEGRKVRTLDIPGRFSYAEFAIGGSAVVVGLEGGTASLYSAETGEKITDNIKNIGGSNRKIFYDRECRRVNVWSDEGRVLRYTYGWYIFGRENWFWPAASCQTQ